MQFVRSRRASIAIAMAVGAVLSGAVSLGPVVSAGASDPADVAAAHAAASWLTSQQQPDGGFEVAGFPGFETPDAVLAIAESAQTGSTWSPSQAFAAVDALHANGGGPTPIDALDDWVSSGVNAGEASKLLLLVVSPLGLDPHHFGPSGHDLAAIVYPSGCAAPPDTSGLFFIETMFVAFGGEELCGAPSAGVLATIRAAQRPDGGWNFLGDSDDAPNPADSDVDTTATAVQALVLGGAAWNDPAIRAALEFLATQQGETGAFRAFGADDPNATAVATLAITAAGFDAATSCWRDTVDPAKQGTAYASPVTWLRSQQQGDGRITSPNDGFGVNTFATSQSVQALLRTWLPIARSTGAPTCAATPPAPDEPDAVDPVALVPRFTG